MSSCFGFRKAKGEDTEALLPQYGDDTSLQRSLHQKMHTYQMLVTFPFPLFPTGFNAEYRKPYQLVSCRLPSS